MPELSNKTRIILAAIILIPVLLYWGFSSSPNESISQNTKAKNTIDYFVENATFKEWDSDGSLLRKTESILLEHYPKEKASHLDKPINTSYRTDHSQLKISSDKGTVRDNNRRTDLSGNVVVIDNPDTESQTIINTNFLTIYPKKDYAETEEHVTITSPHSKLEGVGMDVTFDTRILNLHSRVKGTHSNAE
ncbi:MULTISPECIES: LPS export ABC transporter periplasmic protein LptC [unclassified Neptuniibacter]|uniref:LPS export ABC transporter periplasmic protein LptC n=1 Tax=unclassified Neptuniibacter TaxID=2630693 RepID=UPI000C3B7A99|nr:MULTISPECIES: LPS export ABC transporter periplasmic protein LptC [unclassified Neptuniibacter]MAY42329.1 LPS export ABC transporter periplasmic protein LptC [Oceanospirillaceae bacterium]|tara:strand:- start:24917 stop:25489 length:573 start_codon:yes stop_codon:yes gene_type:complete